MCDYSLEEAASQPARESVPYVTKRLGAHGTIGLAEPNGTVAVCVLYKEGERPHADRNFSVTNIPRTIATRLMLSGTSTTAIFTTVNRGAYCDGIKFRNGATISLQDLGPGVCFEMLPVTNKKPIGWVGVKETLSPASQAERFPELVDF